jgi:hypothetical protein
VNSASTTKLLCNPTIALHNINLISILTRMKAVLLALSATMAVATVPELDLHAPAIDMVRLSILFLSFFVVGEKLFSRLRGTSLFHFRLLTFLFLLLFSDRTLSMPLIIILKVLGLLVSIPNSPI